MREQCNYVRGQSPRGRAAAAALDGALRRVSSLCPVTHMAKWQSLGAWVPREEELGMCRF